MQHLITYIRKNAMFLILLGSFVFCIVVFGSVLLTQRSAPEPVQPAPQPVEPVDQKPSIKSFEGGYGQDAAVHLSWSINRAGRELQSVLLYFDDRQLGGEMKELSSYTMSQGLYQFPSGNCVFTLHVKFKDGTELTKDVSVYINQVTNISMVEEVIEGGMLLQLTYSYDASNRVSIPRIKLLMGGNYAFEMQYQDTKRTKNGELETAVTTYKISDEKVQPGTYDLRVRWIFDGLNISKDFDVEITK